MLKQTAMGSIDDVLVAHRKQKVTGLIPGGGIKNLLLMVTVLSPKQLVIKMFPALKCQKNR